MCDAPWRPSRTRAHACMANATGPRSGTAKSSQEFGFSPNRTPLCLDLADRGYVLCIASRKGQQSKGRGAERVAKAEVHIGAASSRARWCVTAGVGVTGVKAG